MNRLKESGILDHWMITEGKKLADKGNKLNNNQDINRTMSLTNIQTFFYLLIIGNIIGFKVLFIEIYLLIQFGIIL